MGVRVVHNLYRGFMSSRSTMLFKADAQALFSQNEPSGYPKLYRIMHIHRGISWDILAPGLLPYSSTLPLHVWHTRPQAGPQLFFNCLVRHGNGSIGRLPKTNTWVSDPDDIEASLVFYSALKLPPLRS